ncbi:MAG: hypothetical protein KA163_12695 [Bacteroidia bacterium]|nr:hypothetical protein [Bacteroidia bacterium]
MKKVILLILFCSCLFSIAQTTTKPWSLKLSSHVELRTWKLTYKSDKTEKSLPGASLVLTKQGKVIWQGSSDSNGDYTVMVPGNDVFILTVSYPGCNSKKIEIVTTGVPEEVQNSNFYPSFSIIGGFIMAKPFPGIDYNGLQEPLVKVVYSPKIKNFDDDHAYTDYGIGIVSKIKNAEQILIDKFCGTNKKGDDALAIPDCPLAKRLYNEAIALIPGEEYPVVQLAKVPDCDKIEEEKKKAEEEKKAAEIAAKKAAEEKAAAEKANKEKAAADKAEADRLAKEKAAAEKEAKAKAAAEKAEADKLAKQKAAEEKAAAAKTNTVAPKPKPEKKPEKKPEEKVAETPKNKMPDSEKEIKKHEYETKSDDGDPEIGHGDSKYRKPQVIGANKYKEYLSKAEGLYKMKRWAEAKTAYENVLKEKPGDPYATSKLEEVNKMLDK